MIFSEFQKTMRQTLRDTGVDSPELDVRILMEYVTGFSRADLIMRADDAVPQDQIDQMERMLARRLSGEPIDHILGYREFYGRRFDISKDVLSPRPETEGLIDKALGFLENRTSPYVLDLGAGSGAIIVTLLSECLDAEGVAVDVSDAALHVATKNAKAHNVIDRLSLLRGNWFEPVKGTFDLIVSNPPYITDAAMNDLSIEVRDFDPDISLRGGPKGLEAYKVILKEAQTHVKSDGLLLFEIGYDQCEAVSALMKQSGFVDVEVLKDLAGHDRIVSGRPRDN